MDVSSTHGVDLWICFWYQSCERVSYSLTLAFLVSIYDPGLHPWNLIAVNEASLPKVESFSSFRFNVLIKDLLLSPTRNPKHLSHRALVCVSVALLWYCPIPPLMRHSIRPLDPESRVYSHWTTTWSLKVTFIADLRSLMARLIWH